jgi:hypothetical protein
VGCTSPQDRASSEGELPRAERFRDVVVDAELQPSDPVLLGGLGRQHDDRDLGVPTDLADHRPPADVGQPEVDDQQVGGAVAPQLERLGARAGCQDTEALALEVAAHEVTDLGLVLHDEDQRRHGGAVLRSPLRVL